MCQKRRRFNEEYPSVPETSEYDKATLLAATIAIMCDEPTNT